MRFAVLILLLVCGISSAQHQPIKTTEGNSAKATRTQAADKRGTPESPIVVRVQPGPEDPIKAQADEKREKDKTEIDQGMLELNRHMRNITIGLGFIAFLQLVAAAFQTWWVGGTLKATRTAAEAARDSVQLAKAEFAILGRPKVILRDATSEQDMGELIVVRYTLANVGNTKARVLSRYLRVKVFKGWEFGPDNLPCESDTKSEPGDITLQPGEQAVLAFTTERLRWSDSNGTCHAFLEPEYGMFFYGQVTYEDDSGTKRSIGFRRKFISNQHRFVRVDLGNHYEYED